MELHGGNSVTPVGWGQASTTQHCTGAHCQLTGDDLWILWLEAQGPLGGLPGVPEEGPSCSLGRSGPGPVPGTTVPQLADLFSPSHFQIFKVYQWAEWTLTGLKPGRRVYCQARAWCAIYPATVITTEKLMRNRDPHRENVENILAICLPILTMQHIRESSSASHAMRISAWNEWKQS